MRWCLLFHVWTGNAIEQWDAGRYISDRQLSNGLFRGSWGLLTARLFIAETPCTLQACGNNYSMTWVKYIFKRHRYFFYQITVSKITAAKGWQGRVWKIFLQDCGFWLKMKMQFWAKRINDYMLSLEKNSLEELFFLFGIFCTKGYSHQKIRPLHSKILKLHFFQTLSASSSGPVPSF